MKTKRHTLLWAFTGGTPQACGEIVPQGGGGEGF
jgi:hypothetical protein